MIFRKIRANQLVDFKIKSELNSEFKIPSIINVYLNPTELEIESSLIKSNFMSIRGVIDPMGNIFCWQGDILHRQIIIGNHISIDESKLFRFACEKKINWTIDLNGMNFIDGIKTFIKYQDKLSNYGDLNKEINFHFGKIGNLNKNVLKEYCIDITDKYIGFNGIDNIKKFIEVAENN